MSLHCHIDLYHKMEINISELISVFNHNMKKIDTRLYYWSIIGTTTLDNWQYILKLTIHLPYDLAILLWGICSKEMGSCV